MAQFVFLFPDPLNAVNVAVPYDVNIYRTDQVIVWKNLVPGTQWSTQRPRPIVFNDAWLADGGSEAEPTTGPDDVPLWTANGPGPRTEGARAYAYEVYLEPVGGGSEIRILKPGQQIPVDPDIWNQPQP